MTTYDIINYRLKTMTIWLPWAFNSIYRFADHVSKGDEVLVQVNEELVMATVVNVLTNVLQGKLMSEIYSS